MMKRTDYNHEEKYVGTREKNTNKLPEKPHTLRLLKKCAQTLKSTTKKTFEEREGNQLATAAVTCGLWSLLLCLSLSELLRSRKLCMMTR